MTKVLSIDVGGTKISHCVIDEKGEVLSEIEKIKTPKTLDEMFGIFKDIIAPKEQEVDAIAFATAGAVNLKNTKVESSTPNLPEGYSTIDFASLSAKPVYVENDANAAAWAEYKLGSVKGHENTIIITLGTGIGGGIITNGNLLRGKSGRAAEVGSIKLFPDKRRQCTCLNYDCWESYASGTGLKVTANEMTQTAEEFKNSFLKDKKTGEITTHNIIDGVKSGDTFCIKAFDEWHKHLLAGLITLTNIFDPQSIAISGGMGEFINFGELEKEINNSIVVSPIQLLPAKMKNNAGMIGAALLASEKI